VNFVYSIALGVSGALIVSSITLPMVGLARSSISYRAAVIISGVGVGCGTSLFIFFSISKANFVESVITGILVGIAAALGFHTYHKLR